MAKEFEVDGKIYSVRLPNSKEREEGERIHNRIFSIGVRNGGLLESQVMELATANGLWNKEKEAELKALKEELLQKETSLDEGGIEVDEAKKIAIEMRAIRTKIIIYNLMLEEIRSESVGRKAEMAKMEFFISRCTYCDGKPVFKDLDDFYNRQNDPVAQHATSHFNRLWFNYNDDTFRFPEDVFLDTYFKEEDMPEPAKKEKKPFLKNGVPVTNGS